MTVTVTIGKKTYGFNNGKENKDIDESLSRNNLKSNGRTVRIVEPSDDLTNTRQRPDRTLLKKLQRRPSMIQMIRRSIEDGEEDICYLDKYSRIVFPISYAIFLGIYFGIYTVRWENLVNADPAQ